ncbi:hypothetical protein D3H64_04110 [Atopobacter sp. AH10]|uniref:zinc ribbon domain-containing protein n=1 Tax=Atopobacter sp. AH10 TaxID=2315861 RepID=UPI000EF1BDCD|nr:zinc-ribbon domain-containing protein [Atopobacter sp. AH10]RLK63427.1 hypothetical protein D3H64_04110 [Atopobacter sp. AH10]
MKNCPECGSENRDEALFCLSCGRKLPIPKVLDSSLSCSNCGSSNRIGAHFCLNCGKSLEDENALAHADKEWPEEGEGATDEVPAGDREAEDYSASDEVPAEDGLADDYSASDDSLADDYSSTDTGLEDGYSSTDAGLAEDYSSTDEGGELYRSLEPSTDEGDAYPSDAEADAYPNDEEADVYPSYHEDDMAIPLDEWERLNGKPDLYDDISKEDLYKMSLEEAEARANRRPYEKETEDFAESVGEENQSAIVFHADGSKDELEATRVFESGQLAGVSYHESASTDEADPDFQNDQVEEFAASGESFPEESNACPYCGAAKEDGMDFCQNCGQPFLNAEVEEEAPVASPLRGAGSSEPNASHKKKGTWFLLLICLLGLLGAGGYKYAEASVSKEKQINTFIKEIADGDSQAVAEKLRSDDKSLTLSARTVEPLVNYLSTSESLQRRLKNQLMTGESKDFGLSLEKEGKIWKLFPRYVFSVKPVRMLVTSNKKGVSFYTLGEKWATSDSDKFKGEIGPLVPGKYTIRAVLKEKNGKQQVMEKTKLVLPSQSKLAQIDFEMVEIPVKSKDKKAKEADVLLNGKKVGQLKDGQTRLGPVFYEPGMKVALRGNNGLQSRGVQVPQGQKAPEMSLDFSTQANKKELERLERMKQERRRQEALATARIAEEQRKAKQDREEAARRQAERKRQDEVRRQEADRKRKEEEAKRQEEERKRKEEEAKRQEADRKRKEEEAKRQEEERKRKEEEAKRQEEERKRKEEEAKRQEEERKRKEEEAKRQEERKRKEEEAKRQEADRIKEAQDFVGKEAEASLNEADSQLSDDYRHELEGLNQFYQKISTATFYANSFNPSDFEGYFENGKTNPAYQQLISYINSCREQSKKGEILGVRFKAGFKKFEKIADRDGGRKISYQLLAETAYPKASSKENSQSSKVLENLLCQFDVDSYSPRFDQTNESLLP